MKAITDRIAVNHFFKAKMGVPISEDFRGMIWIEDRFEGKIMQTADVSGAVAFNNFAGRSANIHVIVQDSTYLSRWILREIFTYAFIDCGLGYLFGPVDSLNRVALEFNRRLGFKELISIPDVGLEADLVVFGMAKADCNWLKKEKNYGRRICTSST